MSSRPGRNDPCPCGSGNKYKKCCLEQDDAARSAELAASAAAAAAAAAATADGEAPAPTRGDSGQQRGRGPKPLADQNRPPPAARRRSV